MKSGNISMCIDTGITSSNELLQQLLGGEEGARRVLMNGPLGERYRQKATEKERFSKLIVCTTCPHASLSHSFNYTSGGKTSKSASTPISKPAPAKPATVSAAPTHDSLSH